MSLKNTILLGFLLSLTGVLARPLDPPGTQQGANQNAPWQQNNPPQNMGMPAAPPRYGAGLNNNQGANYNAQPVPHPHQHAVPPASGPSRQDEPPPPYARGPRLLGYEKSQENARRTAERLPRFYKMLDEREKLPPYCITEDKHVGRLFCCDTDKAKVTGNGVVDALDDCRLVPRKAVWNDDRSAPRKPNEILEYCPQKGKVYKKDFSDLPIACCQDPGFQEGQQAKDCRVQIGAGDLPGFTIKVAWRIPKFNIDMSQKGPTPTDEEIIGGYERHDIILDNMVDRKRRGKPRKSHLILPKYLPLPRPDGGE